MKLLPPYLLSTTSAAERKLFLRFQAVTSLEGWYCFHSLGVSRHIYKREGEIDFILVGPLGVFVIEVKGGRVSRDNGRWKFTDRYGRVTEKRESPFSQARTALYSVRDELEGQLGAKIHKYTFGYGVAFPDILFDTRSPEWSLETVLDVEDASRPIEEYVVRLANYWRGRQHATYLLKESEVIEIANYIRGDFDSVRPVSIDIAESEESLIALTQEQYHCLDAMQDNDRVMFTGAAGSGKTLLAIEGARRAKLAGRKVLFLCFNKLLAQYVKRVLADAEGSGTIEVASLHSYFYAVIANAGLADRLQAMRIDQPNDQVYSDIYPKLFKLAWRERTKYDDLIIDEAQDVLSENYMSALSLLIDGGFNAGHWSIFLDPENQKDLFQKIDAATLELLRSKAVTYRLTMNCRNTRQIALQAEGISGYKFDQIQQVTGIPVEYLGYTSIGEQASKVGEAINKLIAGGARASDITILSAKRYSDSLTGTGNLRLPSGRLSLDADNIGNPRGEAIGYASISAYKGLESPIVIITDVEELATDWARTINYVGFTRARSVLIVAIREDLIDEYQKKMQALLSAKPGTMLE